MKLTLKFHTTQWLLAAGRKLFSAVPVLLMPCWTLAANLEETAGAPPTELVSVWYVALFFVLFFGMIIGFFAYLWWHWKKQGE